MKNIIFIKNHLLQLRFDDIPASVCDVAKIPRAEQT